MSKIFIRGEGAYPEEVLVQDQETLDRFLALEIKHTGSNTWKVMDLSDQGRTPFKTLTKAHLTRLEKMDEDAYSEFLRRNGFLME